MCCSMTVLHGIFVSLFHSKDPIELCAHNIKHIGCFAEQACWEVFNKLNHNLDHPSFRSLLLWNWAVGRGKFLRAFGTRHAQTMPFKREEKLILLLDENTSLGHCKLHVQRKICELHNEDWQILNLYSFFL